MKTALIIGAGPAGLTAAYSFLQETDIHPIIIEADDIVGGISRTVRFEGNRIDIGGHRFFSKSKEVTDFWAKMLPLQGAPSMDDKKLGRKTQLTPGGPDPDGEDAVFLHRRRISRIRYLHHFFSYPVKLSGETIKNLGLLRMLRIGVSYLFSCVSKREEKNLEDFMVNRFGGELYRTFFRDYTEKVWGRAPKDIGADWGAQRIKGVSLYRALKDFFCRALGITSKEQEASLIEEFIYPKHGPGELWEHVAEEVKRMGGEILMETEAVSFDMEGEHIEGVHVRDGEGERVIRPDYIISSMPIKDLVERLPRPQVARDVLETAVSLPYRDFMTAGLLVDKMEVSNETDYPTLGNIVPDCWIYVQEPEVKLGRLQIFNNWSPYMVEDAEHKVWIGLEYFCQEGDDMWTMPDADFVDFAAGELEAIGLIKKERVEKSCLIRMKKAYPAYFGTYKDFPRVEEYLSGIENLFCVGRNGQHRYNNMDHSMLSALAAVRTIKRGSKDKTAVWNVNTEKEYHEESAK